VAWVVDDKPASIWIEEVGTYWFVKPWFQYGWFGPVWAVAGEPASTWTED